MALKVISMITMRNDSPLDIDAVRAFALVAELASFTRAAQASGTTQSAVSLKLKRLEARLARRLVERTPRLVRLTADGADFLGRARELLAAHDRAVAGADAVEQRLTVGISDHVAGPDLAPLIARVNAFDAGLLLDVRIDFSNVLLQKLDDGKLDAAIVRREGNRRGGEPLLEDEFGWFAAPRFRRPAGERLRLAMLAPPCGVRAHAIRTLDKARLDWVEAFTGGGVSAIAAAISCGLAVAPLARRIAPPGTIDVGPALALPPLGRSKVVLHARTSDARARAALRTLAAAFRSMARSGQ
jgi:DNA-binding transcriptional LysR family regulator